jgi:DtxR family transcriptional regulator, Mn-dependent transcriptional regulator
METTVSQEAEEYIETIYKLQKRNGTAKTKELSETMHVVPGSITNTIEHLESHGLVTHEPYHGVKLTRKGEKIALEILRKHRLAECLLTDILKVDWSSVHEDACKLEHALTKNLTDLLDERLGYPKYCPHGNPIPTENGLIEDQPCKPLTEIVPGEACFVDRIVDEEHVDLEFLAEKQIRPQTSILLVAEQHADILVQVGTKQFWITRELASRVLVRSKEKNNHVITPQ